MKDNYFKDIKVPENINLSVKEGIDRANKEKSKKMIKNTMVAGLLGIVIIGGFTTLNGTAYASINKAIYDIRNFLGIEKDLDNYTTVVNKSIEKQGVTVTLNEVILDDNELIIYKTISSDKKVDVMDGRMDEKIFINGEYLSTSSHGSSYRIDEYTIQEVMFYNPNEDIDLSGNLEIKIDISKVHFKNESITDNWDFEFKASGDELLVDTTEMPLSNTFKLENGDNIKLEKYTSNNIGQKIYFSKDISGDDYDMLLRGSDNLNNKIEFEVSSIRSQKGVFRLSTVEDNLDENATELKLTLYAGKSSEMSGEHIYDLKKVGDEFTIDLTKIK